MTLKYLLTYRDIFLLKLGAARTLLRFLLLFFDDHPNNLAMLNNR